MYKIIAKILSSRLKVVLYRIIDQMQSASMKGIGLPNSVLVANEPIVKLGDFLLCMMKRLWIW